MTILNSKDDYNPEREARKAKGLNDQGLIVDLGKYLGIRLVAETMQTDNLKVDALWSWAMKHEHVVAMDSTARFCNSGMEFSIMVPNKADHYVGFIRLRATGKFVHQTGPHSKIPSVLKEFKDCLEYLKEKKR